MAQWIDYEPYADRSVAEFRAKREMCGISLYDVAGELGVAVNTVKRWENPNYFPPSPAAWRFIDRAYDRHCDNVADALQDAIDSREPDKPITVLWWRNGMSGVNDAQVGMHNAVSRAVAESLMTLGYEVTFRWSDPDAEEAQREATSSFYRRSDPNLQI
jgi:transcriptional regulator with XRE-family HTH domain